MGDPFFYAGCVMFGVGLACFAAGLLAVRHARRELRDWTRIRDDADRMVQVATLAAVALGLKARGGGDGSANR